MGRKAALNPRTNRNRKKRALRGFCDGLVHQQNRNVIAYRICPEAGATLQALAVGFEYERLFADGTNQNIEQFLGNHGRILRLHQPRLKPVRIPQGAPPHPAGVILEDRARKSDPKIGPEDRTRRSGAFQPERENCRFESTAKLRARTSDASPGRKANLGMIDQDVAMPRFDFHHIPRVNFSNVLIRSFTTFWFARPHPCDGDWEAGENPALPRNCKRGNFQPFTGGNSGKIGC